MLFIIADDLTGALDAAAPFAVRGLSTQVATGPEGLNAALQTRSQVIAVSTRSREMPPDQAHAAFGEVLARYRAIESSGTRLFKKVNSRLKGHIADELAQIAPRALLLAPALPEFGRFVEAGAVTGFGVDQPIPTAPLLRGLAAHTQVPDTKTPADMDAALASAPEDALIVGARGIAEAMARKMTGKITSAPVLPQAARALMVVGSRDPISLPQVETLIRDGRAELLGAPSGIVPQTGGQDADYLVVQALPGDGSASSASVMAALSEGIHPRLTQDRSAVFITGGATAEVVLRRMGITHFSLLGEVLPGLPVAQAGDLYVITKSGGFGDGDTLLKLQEIFAAA